MTSPAFDPTSAQRAQRVSLGGNSEQMMTAALDDAAAKLAAIAELTIAESGPSVDEAQANAIAMRLIESIASAPSRRDALKTLVSALASLCPEASVRGGLGRGGSGSLGLTRGRMSQFVDHRLGWLGPESSLYEKALRLWSDTDSQASIDPSEHERPQGIERASVRRIDRTIELNLPAPEGTGRCKIWIEGPLGQIGWLPSMVLAINAVLWNRPTRSLPSLAIGVIRRSTVLLVVGILLLLVALIWPVPYRVSCTAHVETRGGRFVSTPFAATLLSAHVRPGDAVSAGQTLLTLDGRPLRLERESLVAEIGQIGREYDVALATRRIADAQQAELKQKQLTRQLDLITDRLGHLEVVSPLDGIVVSGDLEKHLGSPLELGQTLIEVAPLGTMRLEIDVPEHEIGFIAKGNDARIKIDAIGGPSIRLPIMQLHPQSELRDDANVFIASIDLENADGKMRPGMRGEAVIYGPRRPWIWSWVRGGFERLLWWAGY